MQAHGCKCVEAEPMHTTKHQSQQVQQKGNALEGIIPMALFTFLLLLVGQSLFLVSAEADSAGSQGSASGEEASEDAEGPSVLALLGFFTFISVPIGLLFLAALAKLSMAEREKLLFNDFLEWDPQDEDTFTPGEDLQYWKLHVDEGRQRWFFHPPDGEKSTGDQHIWEKYFLGRDISEEEVPTLPKPTNALEAARNGVKFYEKLQTEDGHWGNDYGGPLFLMPGLVFTCYITGEELRDEQKREMIRYLTNKQNKNGGWGIHVESGSTIFGTGLNYVALRLLGVAKDHPVAVKARKFLQDKGGVLGIPSWGKLWLATLGLYDWAGVSPVLPELWLLPYWVPIHPGRIWCHARMVYLPMAYLYGVKATCKENDLIRELRTEIYTTPYHSINWPAYRDYCHVIDRYVPLSTILKLVNYLLRGYERFHSKDLRKKALEETLVHIRYDDKQTKYVNIGPVNKVMNMLCIWFEEGNSEAVKQHRARLDDYLWLARDGMKMQGYNGCQLWDTAFAVQAICETGLQDEFETCLRNAHEYIRITQVPIDYPERDRHYHHISKGAWPFSTRDHGWPIADCTGEGLRAALAIRKHKAFDLSLTEEQLADAVNVLLSFQNTDGGWPTYELKRAGSWFELFNPSEVFGAIMVDYSYVELSSASMKAMLDFLQHFPTTHHAAAIRRQIPRGVDFIKRIQRADGSWYGSWAVCFTYGTWFGVEALVMCGEHVNSPAVQRAVNFLLTKQNPDGGWGEDFQSCVRKEYVQNKRSQVVNTAWALLALMAAKTKHRDVVDRGIAFLMGRQLPNGDWKQESISGVFNGNCSISYESYKNIFPIWALGRYARQYSIRK